MEDEGDDGVDEVDEAAPETSTPGRAATWLRRLVQGVAAALALAVAGVAVLVGPWVRDDLLLDRVVRAVVLDWRDFGLARAEERLQHELDVRGIGMQVSDEDCSFSEPFEDAKRVRCVWQVDLELPGLSRSLPIVFSSQADLDPAGELR